MPQTFEKKWLRCEIIEWGEEGAVN
jgi:hypothetical protein